MHYHSQSMAANAQRIIALLERTLSEPGPRKSLSTLTDRRRELDELDPPMSVVHCTPDAPSPT